jgi:hypothetical protein
MKQAEFEHVTLRTETRSDNGETSHIITWYPVPKKRMRKTFSKESDALAEARRIEGLFSNGYSGLTKLPTPEMALFIMQCEQMRVQPHAVMQFYLAHHSTNGATATVIIKDAGNAFVATRADQEKFSARGAFD